MKIVVDKVYNRDTIWDDMNKTTLRAFRVPDDLDAVIRRLAYKGRCNWSQMAIYLLRSATAKTRRNPKEPA